MLFRFWAITDRPYKVIIGRGILDAPVCHSEELCDEESLRPWRNMRPLAARSFADAQDDSVLCVIANQFADWCGNPQRFAPLVNRRARHP